MYGTLTDSPVDLAKLTQSIKLHEGLRLLPYLDTVGKITIGYGRNISDKGISLDEASILLDHDISAVLEQAQSEPWWQNVKGNDVRARACCEIIFNIGIGDFRTFKNAISCLLANDFSGAARNFLDSQWTRQVNGRAVILCRMIETGLD